MKNIPCERLFSQQLPKEYQLRRLRKVIRQELTEKQRQTLYAYYFEGKKLPQIAREQGVHKSTAWRTLKRAEDRVRRVMMY